MMIVFGQLFLLLVIAVLLAAVLYVVEEILKAVKKNWIIVYGRRRARLKKMQTKKNKVLTRMTRRKMLKK